MDSIQWGLKISMNSTVLCTTVILKRMCLFDIDIYIYIYIYIYSSSFIYHATTLTSVVVPY